MIETEELIKQMHEQARLDKERNKARPIEPRYKQPTAIDMKVLAAITKPMTRNDVRYKLPDVNPEAIYNSCSFLATIGQVRTARVQGIIIYEPLPHTKK